MEQIAVAVSRLLSRSRLHITAAPVFFSSQCRTSDEDVMGNQIAVYLGSSQGTAIRLLYGYLPLMSCGPNPVQPPVPPLQVKPILSYLTPPHLMPGARLPPLYHPPPSSSPPLSPSAYPAIPTFCVSLGTLPDYTHPSPLPAPPAVSRADWHSDGGPTAPPRARSGALGHRVDQELQLKSHIRGSGEGAPEGAQPQCTCAYVCTGVASAEGRGEGGLLHGVVPIWVHGEGGEVRHACIEVRGRRTPGKRGGLIALRTYLR